MDKNEIILCDSNVIIDWINHRQKAIDDLQRIEGRLDMPDSLIAATAIELNLPLFTYNIKDFRYIPGLQLYK